MPAGWKLTVDDKLICGDDDNKSPDSQADVVTINGQSRKLTDDNDQQAQDLIDTENIEFYREDASFYQIMALSWGNIDQPLSEERMFKIINRSYFKEFKRQGLKVSSNKTEVVTIEGQQLLYRYNKVTLGKKRSTAGNTTVHVYYWQGNDRGIAFIFTTDGGKDKQSILNSMNNTIKALR